MALDLVRRQVVAGARVRQAEIAADDEGAEPGLGQAFRLRDAEPADHLHRGGAADPLEDGAGHVTQIVSVDERRVGAPRVGLQVNADPVHSGLEHAPRDLDGLRGRALVRHEDIGKREPRQFGVGAPELVAHGANRLGRIHTGEREEINDVAAARIDGARLEGPAIHGLHVGQQERFGKFPAESWHDVRDAFVLEQRRPHFDDGDPARQRRSGHPETLLHGGHVDRNLERETGSEPFEHASGGRVGHRGRLLGPGIVGPHHLEDGRRLSAHPWRTCPRR